MIKFNFTILILFLVLFSSAQVSKIFENMVLVEGSSFKMGQPNPDLACKECTKDEQPVHKVSLSSYYISKFELTQKIWNEVMGDSPSYEDDCGDCPVEGVSWNDIQKFLTKLNELTGKKYRLPTEAEWEFAARGGTKSKGFLYSGSNTAIDIAWYSLKTDKKVHPVGTKGANELGLYDMSGNVWEWCADYYDGNYYATSPEKDPQGPEKGKDRVLRGGSWYSQANDCRVYTRYRFFATFRSNANGFRLALTP